MSDLWEPPFRQAVSMVWRPLLVCPTDQYWQPKPYVTLIGDAAQVMPPYAGEGEQHGHARRSGLIESISNSEEQNPLVRQSPRPEDVLPHAIDDGRHKDEQQERFYAPDA